MLFVKVVPMYIKYPFEFVAFFYSNILMYSKKSSKNFRYMRKYIFIASHLGGFRDERAG